MTVYRIVKKYGRRRKRNLFQTKNKAVHNLTTNNKYPTRLLNAFKFTCDIQNFDWNR